MYDYDSFLFFVFPPFFFSFFSFFFFCKFWKEFKSNSILYFMILHFIHHITAYVSLSCKQKLFNQNGLIYTISLLVRRLKMSFLFFFRIYYLSIAVVKMWPLTQDCSLFASFANYRRNSNPIPTSCSCCHFLPITVLLTFLCYATKTPQSGIFR